MDALFQVTPFYDAPEALLSQDFRGEWTASPVKINLENVVADTMGADQSADDNLSWSEKFFTGVTTEAKEIFEGAKNFAKNAAVLFYNTNSGEGVDPKTIHKGFDETYGWAQISYEVQFYDVDLPMLEAIFRDETLETLQEINSDLFDDMTDDELLAATAGEATDVAVKIPIYV